MTDNLRKVVIDNVEIDVDPAFTIMQACEKMNKEIPRFCYHERLSIAGNCRMCLVEVVGGPPKPMASCALQIKDLRPGPNGEPPIIKTNSPMVKKAREGVMEFLLINHPLDCPICDQGGECDLQDQALSYGVDFSRYREPKRAALDVNLGPLVETNMTRCISCTRCVRFITEVAGVPEMGQIGRGESSEITSYLGQTLTSELQGNIIDLCPVGALTSKPYAFSARPWELIKTNTIDVMDALGSNIRVDSKGKRIMRIIPRNHDGINEEWLSDKSRFMWDGLSRQRLDKPYIRNISGRLEETTWDLAFNAISDKCLPAAKILAISGDLVSAETLYAAKKLVNSLKGKTECRIGDSYLPPRDRAAYAGTAHIGGIDVAEQIFLIGTNPRLEAPVLNARIRRAWLRGAEIKLVGEPVSLTYEYQYLGPKLKDLSKLSSNFLKANQLKNTLIILGQGALLGEEGPDVLHAVKDFKEKTNSELLTLHVAASKVGAMDLDFVCDMGYHSSIKWSDVVLNLGVDDYEIPKGPFVIYQGSHGDRGAERADIILPGCAFTEESGTFVNTEGRPQMAFKACETVGDARENWAILRALSERLNVPFSFNSFDELRTQLFHDKPLLGAIDEVPTNAWKSSQKFSKKCLEKNLNTVFKDHYLTNAIARSSVLLAELSKNKNKVNSKKGLKVT
ncbi:MAG: NADH-quinone oxidoreductase subunit G [Rhodobacteraceae bacterium]|nr:MAG: NADH-quinone oxidoreductase subunit G [Paracoccaceae bacterium]